MSTTPAEVTPPYEVMRWARATPVARSLSITRMTCHWSGAPPAMTVTNADAPSLRRATTCDQLHRPLAAVAAA